LTPRLTTAFTLTGSPAADAASMPSSTRATGKSTSFIALKVSSSSESSDTVTRVRPASLSACALRGRSAPFVVSVRSRPGIAASMDTSTSTSARSSGSPPVSRILRTPSDANVRATRSISSNVRSSRRGRNA
jgi:hypothetical protein